MTEAPTPDRPAARLPQTPYVGLVPYREADAAFFFGRDTERRIVAGNLRAYRLTILYGPSGVGKTSLLQAGVVPDLREHARAGRRQVRADAEAAVERPPVAICTFRSWRDDPVPALADAIRAAVVEAAEPHDLPPWREGERLADAVRAWTGRVRTILVVLDQFEEYFLYHEDDEGPGTFAAEFPPLVNEPNLRINVLLSIREDAWAKLDRFEARIPRLFANYIRVDHLDRAAARAAIEGPVAVWNRRLAPDEQPYAVEEALVEAVLDASASAGLAPDERGERPGVDEAPAAAIEAPFLQLVMERIWRATAAKGSRELTLATLEELGGAEQIVESHLLEALSGLAPEEQAAAAQFFRFLVTRSRTKIAHSTSDLADWTGRPQAEVAVVLEKLSRGEGGRILRRVPPLDPEREPMRYELFHDVLSEPILEWRRGYEHERARRAALRRYARIGAGLLSLVVVFAALSVWALLQRSEARRATRSATSLALAATAKAEVPRRLDDALLLSLEAYLASPTAEAADAAMTALEAARRSGAEAIVHAGRGGARTIALSPDGGTLASAAFGGTIRLWDVRAGARRALEPPLRGHTGQVWSIAFSPDGRLFASAGFDGTVRLWDVAKREELREPFRGHGSAVLSVAFAPDGGTLASGGFDGEIRFWDVAAGREAAPALPAHEGRVAALAFSPDGGTLASVGYDGTVGLWDPRTREPLRDRLRGHATHVVTVAFSPDGRTLASADLDGVIRLWNARDGSPVGELPNRAGDVWSVAFSADGATLASSGFDGTVRLWDVRTRAGIGPPLRGHTDRVVSVAFGPDRRTLASAGYDGTVRLWNLAAPRRLGEPLAGRGHSDAVAGVAFGRDGATLASAGSDRTVRLWDVRARRGLGPLPTDAADAFGAVAFSPDGRVLAAGAGDGKVRLWDARSRRALSGPFADHDGAITGIAFGSAGDALATAGADGVLRLWDVERRRPLVQPLRGHEEEISSVAFSADGRTIATAGIDRTLRLWDARDGSRGATVVHRAEEGSPSAPVTVAFDPVGRTLAAGTVGGGIRLWDVESETAIGQPLKAQESPVTSVAFSPDDRTLAVAADDGRVRLWDVRARKRVGPPLDGHAGRVTGVAFSPDGRTLASAGEDRTVRLWEGILWHDREDLKEQICDLVVGALTPAEWAALVPGVAHRASCDG